MLERPPCGSGGEVFATEPGQSLFHLPGRAADDGQVPQVLPGDPGELVDDLDQSAGCRGLELGHPLSDQSSVTRQEFAALVSDLSARGVTFEICEITLKNRNLKKEQFILGPSFTPSGVVLIAHLQAQEHYAYIKP